MAEIRRVLTASGATSDRVSRDERERLLLWSGRKPRFPPWSALADYYCIDGTIRARRCAVLRRTASGRRSSGSRARTCSRGRRQPAPADPVDANKAGEIEKTIAFGDRILELCIEVGGT